MKKNDRLVAATYELQNYSCLDAIEYMERLVQYNLSASDKLKVYDALIMDDAVNIDTPRAYIKMSWNYMTNIMRITFVT